MLDLSSNLALPTLNSIIFSLMLKKTSVASVRIVARKYFINFIDCLILQLEFFLKVCGFDYLGDINAAQK
jgi:hypothetical protein